MSYQEKKLISQDANGESVSRTVAHEAQQTSTALKEKRALTLNLMEMVCERENLNRAYKRVKGNKGAPGIDGMSIDELFPWIVSNKDSLIAQLLDGSFKPTSLRRVDIPKPGNNQDKRSLSIPTVVDRLVQQAMLQVLEPILDPTFSESSFGFRLGRSAHQAVKQAQSYAEAGYGVVVDMDLENFFNEVNHDILMSRLARRIGDKNFLRITRRFIKAGILYNGVCARREHGVAQGGPLSPILSNLLLDDLDKELERRGHKFCRYGDDCNVYVRSIAAGERVMASIKQFLEKKLKLKVNQKKSAVAKTWERQFLGYQILRSGKLGLASRSTERIKARIKQLTKRNRGRSIEQVISEVNQFLIGWINYFKYVVRSPLQELDEWIRRKLRCYRVKQLKRTYTIAKFLMTLGISENQAWRLSTSEKGWWRLSKTPQAHMAMDIKWFRDAGLVSLTNRHKMFKTL
jgi:RNA-directed DNA polymerase